MALSTVSILIKRVFRGGRVEYFVDSIAVEFEVEIYVNDVREAVLETSPTMLEELGIGYAKAHGYSISSIYIDNNRISIHANLDSTRSRRPVDGVRITAEGIFRAVGNTFSMAKLFRETGCFHVAALATVNGDVVEFVEDISRHCALYKLMGSIIKKNIETYDKVVVMSSRAASRLIESIAILGIPIALFRGAPTNRAIEKAKELNITLVAHIREDKFNVYTYNHRLLF